MSLVWNRIYPAGQAAGSGSVWADESGRFIAYPSKIGRGHWVFLASIPKSRRTLANALCQGGLPAHFDGTRFTGIAAI